MVPPGTARADTSGTVAGQLRPNADGEYIFVHVCAGCHMPDARGAKGAGYYPALAGDPALQSAEFVAVVLLRGRRNMPPFGARHVAHDIFALPALTPAQIAQVTNYVRSHFGNHFTGTISAAQVAALDTN